MDLAGLQSGACSRRSHAVGGGGQPRGLASLVLLACCRVLLRAHGTEREDLMTQRSVHPGVRRRPQRHGKRTAQVAVIHVAVPSGFVPEKVSNISVKWLETKLLSITSKALVVSKSRSVF